MKRQNTEHKEGKILLRSWADHVIQRYVIENVCQSSASSFVSFQNL